jgi:alpha-amylase
MPGVCIYFQVHQPRRLKRYRVFDIGRNHLYEDPGKSRQALDELARSCYIPTTETLLKLIEKHKGKFRVAFSISGETITLCEKYREDVLEIFQRLADTGCVEFLNETYSHSLAFLFSLREFKEQIKAHKKKCEELFRQKATAFCCSELIYSNELAGIAEKMGYKVILAEGKEDIPGFKGTDFVYRPANCVKLKLLLRNYRLSDDIQFGIFDNLQNGPPLKADLVVERVAKACKGGGEVVNLFMKYENLGKHNDFEVLNFIKSFADEIIRHDFCFCTPSEIAAKHEPVALLDVPDFVSWSESKRDLTAWVGNAMQRDALRVLYDLEEKARKRKNADLNGIWRMLQASDHFFYMSTENYSQGAKQKYSNPYASPYEAYINYMNILEDFSLSLRS